MLNNISTKAIVPEVKLLLQWRLKLTCLVRKEKLMYGEYQIKRLTQTVCVPVRSTYGGDSITVCACMSAAGLDGI